MNTQDVLAFLNAWTTGSSSGDFNGDGMIDTRDVLEEKLLPTGSEEEAQYGSSVAISHEFVLIAKGSHDGYTGPPALFRRGALGWEELEELRDIFLPYDRNMGIPVRVRGDRAIVGSRGWLNSWVAGC